MVLEHPRARVPHDLAHFFARFRTVAVDGAVGAGRLLRSVGAEIELAVGVVRDFRTVAAQTIAPMVDGAIHLHHQPHGLAFALKPS